MLGIALLRAGAVILVACSVSLVFMTVKSGSANPAFQFDFKGDLLALSRRAQFCARPGGFSPRVSYRTLV